MRTKALVTSHATPPSSGTPHIAFRHVSLDDTLGHDECLISIRASGICPEHDFSYCRQPTSQSSPSLPAAPSQNGDTSSFFPVILGHEAAGSVVRRGSDVKSVQDGDKVILVYASCGRCKYCRRKETAYCDYWFQLNLGGERKQFTHLDGSGPKKGKGSAITSHFLGQSSFARHVVVSESSLVKVPEQFIDLPWETLAAFGCSVMTGAGAILNTLPGDLEDPEILVVTGASAMGLAALMAVKLIPGTSIRKVIMVDSRSSRLELARSIGATHGVNSSHRPDLWKVLMHITDGLGADVCLDTTGQPKTIEALVHGTARKGKIISAGLGDVS